MKNILIFAMSKLRIEKGKVAQSSIKIKDGENMNYYSQLEPVPRMLQLKLKEDKEVLDKIIVLNTRATLTEKTFQYGEGSEMKTVTCSEYEFLKMRLKETVGISEEKNKDLFTSICLEKNEINNPVQKIKALIEAVRAFYSDKKDGVRLYIDSHGGIRSVQTLIDAMISLLKMDDIYPEIIYDVVYDPDTSEGNVIENHLIMNTFDLVAGMNEFINYGRSGNLVSYLEKHDTYKGLAKSIQEISDSIQLCNSYGFDNALENMKTWVEKSFQEKPDDQENSEEIFIDIFVENIKKAYGKLLKNPVTTDKIRWCMENDFIQQALTFLEAQFPEYLFQAHILEWNGGVWLDKNNKEQKVENLQEIIKQAKQKDNRSWMSNESYMIHIMKDSVIDRLDIEFSNEKFGTLDQMISYVDAQIETNLDGKMNERVFAGNAFQTSTGALKFEDHTVRKVVKCGTSSAEGCKNVLKLLVLYWYIRMQRNKINHAADCSGVTGGNAPDMSAAVETLKTLIGTALELADEICMEISQVKEEGSACLENVLN